MTVYCCLLFLHICSASAFASINFGLPYLLSERVLHHICSESAFASANVGLPYLLSERACFAISVQLVSMRYHICSVSALASTNFGLSFLLSERVCFAISAQRTRPYLPMVILRVVGAPNPAPIRGLSLIRRSSTAMRTRSKKQDTRNMEPATRNQEPGPTEKHGKRNKNVFGLAGLAKRLEFITTL